MKWQEVREMYPNQFVKFEIVEHHEDEKTKYVKLKLCSTI
ncbi:hypothetical protein psyc5s11_09620 [Clostridium gelidum]|uniref:Uncharacterized protein n=1 Tax=Clostridium gelidum TaxID=704125 RepID=A0ABM7SZ00_9CLOT|nr:hypothetical protein psyc5s11_09620 [Clostridium gelidum]